MKSPVLGANAQRECLSLSRLRDQAKLERVSMPAIAPQRGGLLIGCVHNSLGGHKFEVPTTTAILDLLPACVYTVRTGRLP